MRFFGRAQNDTYLVLCHSERSEESHFLIKKILKNIFKIEKPWYNLYYVIK